MFIRVLGAAAGGGFPQWNCNHPNSRLARAKDPNAKPRTQSSLAVSLDKKNGSYSTPRLILGNNYGKTQN